MNYRKPKNREAVDISYSGKTIEKIIGFLPENISFSIQSEVKDLSLIEEIHLKSGEKILLSAGGRKRVLSSECTAHTLDSLLSSLTGSSLYAHSETIKNGYILFEGGVRVGVCGNAVCENGKIISLDRITSLNIRIPHSISGISAPVISALERSDFKIGMLIYSLPGVGKTTLLRDIALTLSSFPYRIRISLIDTRRELAVDAASCPSLDVYSGYPPSQAIEMAVRTMSPELIICDEIGGESETNALHSLAGKGIPVIASAHSSSPDELLCNDNIARLHSDRLFKWYVGLKRIGRDMKFDFTPSEELLSV